MNRKQEFWKGILIRLSITLGMIVFVLILILVLCKVIDRCTYSLSSKDALSTHIFPPEKYYILYEFHDKASCKSEFVAFNPEDQCTYRFEIEKSKAKIWIVESDVLHKTYVSDAEGTPYTDESTK